MAPQSPDSTMANPIDPPPPTATSISVILTTPAIPTPSTTTNTSNSSSSKPLTIIVASKNPVKIRAALQAFTRMFPPPPTSDTPDWHTARGISVPSGVPDQPMSDAETLLGAQNRAQRVRELEPGADYWVGIEGGVDFDPDDASGETLRNFAWVVVLGPGPSPTEDGMEDRLEGKGGEDGNGDGEGKKGKGNGWRMGKARTATYYLPRETAMLVKGGMELGHADEVVFGGQNSKQKNGSVGLLTGDVIDRRAYYEEAVVLALIPFRNGGLTF